ncbi:bfpT-regulated chaperone [Escherichia albertii]|uniref:bfpT-regulated chaperone n=1 Tax=Escherichia albertii TaxID=208962 RepID=UPI00074340C2|nr:bfpT-regulated chaperone [Escherichia albertii]
MPVNITGVHFNSFGISCYQKKNLWGGTDEVIKCSLGKRKVRISEQKLSKYMLSSVISQSTKNFGEWVRDEQKVYPSRVINQEIDRYCLEKCCNISGNERKRVFSLVSTRYNLELDVRAAQSSVNHLITGCSSFSKKMDFLCEGVGGDVKNHVSNSITNLLADRFYQKHIDPNVDITTLRATMPRYIMYAISA